MAGMLAPLLVETHTEAAPAMEPRSLGLVCEVRLKIPTSWGTYEDEVGQGTYVPSRVPGT